MTKSTRRDSDTPKNDAGSHPKSLSYYLSSARYHKLVGKFAIKSYFQLKSFLARDKLDSTEKKLDKKSAAAQTHATPKTNPDTQFKNRSEIKEITRRSNEILAHARTVFPFTLFPDDVVLDRTKLTITKRDFFWSGQVLSIRIEDILNVASDVGPLFGSITVATRVLSSDDHFTIRYLPRRDAIHLKHMIQGYVIALHNEIECSHLEQAELIDTLAELGHDFN
jgi:hypothetical protein